MKCCQIEEKLKKGTANLKLFQLFFFFLPFSQLANPTDMRRVETKVIGSHGLAEISNWKQKLGFDRMDSDL